MLERRGGLDLDDETLGAEHGGEFRLQDLDGNLAVVPEILGEEHRRHAALAELAFDAVAVRQCSAQRGARALAHRITPILATSLMKILDGTEEEAAAGHRSPAGAKARRRAGGPVPDGRRGRWWRWQNVRPSETHG
jgi:hypothetical protein